MFWHFHSSWKTTCNLTSAVSCSSATPLHLHKDIKKTGLSIIDYFEPDFQSSEVTNGQVLKNNTRSLQTKSMDLETGVWTKINHFSSLTLRASGYRTVMFLSMFLPSNLKWLQTGTKGLVLLYHLLCHVSAVLVFSNHTFMHQDYRKLYSIITVPQCGQCLFFNIRFYQKEEQKQTNCQDIFRTLSSFYFYSNKFHLQPVDIEHPVQFMSPLLTTGFLPVRKMAAKAGTQKTKVGMKKRNVS